jgi:hypothetical protein
VDVLLGAIILWVIPIFVGISIGRSKGRAGWAYGLFLGWIGVLILALLSPVKDSSTGFRECPFCKEQIRWDAVVCPHCQRDVEPLASAPRVHRSGRLTR